MTDDGKARERWSFSTGERGINRVRVYAHLKTGHLQLQWSERTAGATRVRTISLGHFNQAKAKRAAIEKSAELATSGRAGTGTLGSLFEIYEREVTPRKAAMTQQHDRRTLALFRGYLGADRDPMTLSKRDWDNIIEARRDGRLAPARSRGRPVKNRVIEQDLRLLLAVLRWARASRLIPDMPLIGLRPPTERNPRRPMLTTDQFEAMLAVAGDVDPLMPLALMLAHETGHRGGAIRLLRWSDLDFEQNAIRWRAENDKTRRGHVTPLSGRARAAAMQSRGIGDAWVFPSRRVPGQPVSREALSAWWEAAERRAQLPREVGRGWHSLRRKFGTDLMHQPLRVVQELGGWRSASVLLSCYQQPSIEDQREALADRREVAAR